MRQPLSFLILAFIFYGCAEKNRTFLSSEVSIIPRPNELVLGEESFAFEDGLSVSVENEEQKLGGEFLVKLLKNTANINLVIKDSDEKASIVFAKVEDLLPEAYELNITPKQIIVEANSPSGYFYGVQSIQQLMVEDHSTSKPKWLVPTASIKDAPKFGWRAFMLDEARYFQGEEFVKKILDQMALLKMNVFHWHLTDDAGWRMEIKKYPKLTEIGSHRIDSEIVTWKSGKVQGKPHSGFYTQEQIKSIVAYAAARHITVVPEFEMPGHASAAIAAYTWLGTAGKDIDVPVTFGRHYDNYDVTKPEVFQFVKDVLTEMFELFPSKVIHIGGDEVGYKVWEESNHVQRYMKDNDLNTPADLQIAFTNEISKFIEKNGRRMMGWNEIMGINIHQGFEEKKDDKEAETELAKNVVVHFWKGNLDLATEAAKKGYGIVNSLHSETYLDYSYETISLEKAYNFNPIPEGLDEKFNKNIYGLGCQMWTEWTPTNKDVTYQTFPRIAAYAEVGWTAPENKNFDVFKIALTKLQDHWDVLGIQYARDQNNDSRDKGTSDLLMKE
jgi:hexosaminidase